MKAGDFKRLELLIVLSEQDCVSGEDRDTSRAAEGVPPQHLSGRSGWRSRLAKGVHGRGSLSHTQDRRGRKHI